MGLPLYTHTTSAKTVGMEDTGQLNARNGDAQLATHGDLAMLHRTAPTTSPHTLADALFEESCALCRLVDLLPDHWQLSKDHWQSHPHNNSHSLTELLLDLHLSLTATLIKRIGWSSPQNTTTTPLPLTPFLFPISLPLVDLELSLKPPLQTHPPNHTSALSK